MSFTFVSKYLSVSNYTLCSLNVSKKTEVALAVLLLLLSGYLLIGSFKPTKKSVIEKKSLARQPFGDIFLIKFPFLMCDRRPR